MDKPMYKYYMIALVAVFMTAFCQLLLKLGARHGKERNSSLRLYLNYYTLPAYFFLFVATLFSTYAYKYIPMKAAVILLPVGFILVALLSYWVLREKFSKNQVIGSVIILAGIVVFNL
jgi:drug/metabolite transporter (DMT)-like permease